MRRDLLESLNCPARDCGSHSLTLEVRVVEEVHYRAGPIEEVREGDIVCSSCRRSYPIEDYVPSFEQLFPQELQEEARYWSDWYGFFWDRGYKGFFDIRSPAAHFIARGIEATDPSTLGGKDISGTHKTLANHPMLRDPGRVLDVGCGCGWSSLYLARRGHNVIAFDPSAGNVRRAKLYAISQGEFIEYLAAGLGFLSFQPALFKGVFALHSIHHVPDLRREVAILRDWMHDDAVIAVDEHIQDDAILMAIYVEIEKWFQSDVAARHITMSAEDLASLPKAAHSRLEGAGSTEVMDALADNFSIESFSSRFVSLNTFSFMYYLWSDLDPDAYHHASKVIGHLYDFLQGVYPEQFEYITVIGTKSDGPGPAMGDLCRAKDMLVGCNAQDRLFNELRRALTPQQMLGVEQLKSELEESAGTIKYLQTSLEASNRAVEDLRSMVENLQSHERNLQSSVQTLQSAAENLQSTVKNLNGTIHAKNGHIVELEKELARHAQALAAKHAALEEQAAMIESGRVMRLMNLLSPKRGER